MTGGSTPARDRLLWQSKQLKWVMRLVYGDALPTESRVEGDVDVYGSNGPVGRHDQRNTLAPALIVGRKGSFGKVVFAERGGFCIDTAFYLDARSANCDLRWAYWTLQTLRLDECSEDTGVPGLSREHAHNLRIAVPPRPEQVALANLLDRETARIDALIEKKTRFIELLREKRQALITQAVTRGLDESVPTKPADVDWIGEVPAHWSVMPISLISRKITNGYVGPTREIFVESGVRYLQSLHIKNFSIDFHTPYHVTQEWSANHSKSILQEGDVLVVQTGDLGQVAVVPKDFEGCNCHALIVITPDKERITGKWLGRVLSSEYGFAALLSVQTGALHPHLNCGEVRNILVPIPPIDEQQAIEIEINRRVQRVNALVSATEKSIGVLRERRVALITAAVTGQIDVRAVVPEEHEELA